MMPIEVITGFDGSSPRDAEGVVREADGRIVLRPNLRRIAGTSEETAGRGSRLNVRFRNTRPATEQVTVDVDWGRGERMVNHDIGYICFEGQGEWRMTPGLLCEDRVRYFLALPPGITHFGLYPEYNTERCAEFVQGLAARGVGMEVAGKSREGREIYLLEFSSINPSAKSFFIQARDHAYETAGSYCVEGIAEFLLSGLPMAEYLRSKFKFHIIPMTNPDGVYNGLSRLTWECGADMNRVATVPDPAYDALRGALDRIRPAVFMNIHNWTYKFVDGLLANDQSVADKILKHMPADSEHYKAWQVQTTADFCRKLGVASTPPEHKSWKNYCKDNFGAIGVTFEFPWFGLTTREMKAKGVRAMTALALAAVEEMQL